MARPIRLGAVVLAAGASIRMGRPKGALRWRGLTLLEHAIRQARAARAQPRVVVLGAHALRVPPGEPVVEHPGWPEGPLSSLQAGLRVLDEGGPVAGMLVLTVDRPRVSDETLVALREAFEVAPDRISQPRHEGRRGHPMIWPAAALERMRHLPPTASRRDLLTGPDAMPRALVDVDDVGVIDNIDRPEDLARLGISLDS